MSCFRQKLAMGFGLGLILALLTACMRPPINPTPKTDGQGPRTDATTKPNGPSPAPKTDGPGPTPKANRFDPDDFEATLRWLALQVEPVVEADGKKNKLLVDQRLKEMHATFAKLAGRKVNWRIKVQRVAETKVYLKTYDLEKHFPRPKDPNEPERLPLVLGRLAVSALAASAPPGQPLPGGDWQIGSEGGLTNLAPFEAGLEIGKVISKAQAMGIATGDKVLVRGKVAYCVGSGVDSLFGGRSFALCIVEAKSPD